MCEVTGRSCVVLDESCLKESEKTIFTDEIEHMFMHAPFHSFTQLAK